LLAGWVFERTRRTFYGWWIVAVGMFAAALSGGLFFHGFQFYFEPMRQQFGWSRTLISGAYALSRVESGFLGPPGGYLVERFGPRIMIVVGFMIFGSGFILLGFTNSKVMFYIAFLVLSVGSGLSSWTPVVATLNNWFRRKRARAVGLMMTGLGLGGVMVAPALAYFISEFDWKKTALASGILLFAIGIPLSRVLRYSPEPYGQLPDGDKPDPEGASRSSGTRRPVAAEYDFTVKEALKTPAFWVLSVGHSIALLTVSSLGLHLTPYLVTELHYSPAVGAQALIFMTIPLMVAQPLSGFLGERFDKKYLVAFAMLGHAAAMMLFATAGDLTQVFAASALHGISWGVRGPLLTAMRGDFFGRKHFPVIMGYTQLVTMGGQIVGPLLLGYMADEYSYSAGLKIISIITASGFFIFLFLKNPQPSSGRPTPGRATAP
jgi:MFS family permease